MKPDEQWLDADEFLFIEELHLYLPKILSSLLFPESLHRYLLYIMDDRKVVLLPKAQNILAEFWENIKLARLRIKLSATQVADRAAGKK